MTNPWENETPSGGRSVIEDVCDHCKKVYKGIPSFGINRDLQCPFCRKTTRYMKPEMVQGLIGNEKGKDLAS